MVECSICHSVLSPPYIKCAECVFLSDVQFETDYHFDFGLEVENQNESLSSITIQDENGNPDDIENQTKNRHKLKRRNEFNATGPLRLSLSAYEYDYEDDTSHCQMENHDDDGLREHNFTTKKEETELTSFLICLACFSCSKTIGLHDANHDYEVIRDDFCVVPGSTWSAKEELKLLECIESCGLGNWSSIATYLPGRSARECEKHYSSFFLSVDMISSTPGLRDMPATGLRRPIPYKHVVSNLPPRPAVMSAAYNEISGYMAARGDFSTEHDNHAELIVKDIDFTKEAEVEEGEGHRDLCLALVDIYRFRVLERERRKRIVREYGLLNPHSTDMYFSSLLRWLSNDQVSALQKCMRLLPAQQFLQYIEGLKVEEKLKSEIGKLFDARREGLTRIHQIEIHEKLKARRAETKRKSTALINCIKNLQNETTWQRYIAKTSIADKIGTAAALPHPALGRKQPGPLEIHSLPGYEKINAKERELCSTARLIPNAYLNFKRVLINECRKDGFLRLAKARTLIKIDVNKTRKIYDFLLIHQMINQEPV